MGSVGVVLVSAADLGLACGISLGFYIRLRRRLQEIARENYLLKASIEDLLGALTARAVDALQPLADSRGLSLAVNAENPTESFRPSRTIVITDPAADEDHDRMALQLDLSWQAQREDQTILIRKSCGGRAVSDEVDLLEIDAVIAEAVRKFS